MTRLENAEFGIRNAELDPFRIPHSAFRTVERGSVLLYVIWVVMLLSLFAASVGSQSLFAFDVSQRLAEQLQAMQIARSAVPYAALALARDLTPTSDGQGETWAQSASVFERHPVGKGWFDVVGGGLVDEERRLNLNGAPEPVLSRLFELAGVKPADAEELAAAIIDWRDEDTDQRPLGAEGFYYRSLSVPYDSKDGPFETLEELLLVKGMTPAIYRSVSPHLTVYGAGSLNLNTASREVLRALDLTSVGYEGLLTYRAGEDGQEGTTDDRQIPSVGAIASELEPYVPAEDLIRLAKLVADQVVAVRSEAFRMTIHAATDRPESRVAVDCVIDRRGRLLQWSER